MVSMIRLWLMSLLLLEKLVSFKRRSLFSNNLGTMRRLWQSAIKL
jgi:hypothetical protein